MGRKGRIVAFFLIVIILGGLIGSTTNSVAKGIPLGLDLQGGFELLYEVEPQGDGEVNDTLLDAVVSSLYERVDILGVNEPQIDIEGDNRIRVQLAGVENQNEAREILSTTAQLSFRDVNDKLYFDGSEIVPGSAQQDFGPTNKPVVNLEVNRNFENSDYENFGAVSRAIVDNFGTSGQLVIWMDYEEGDSFEAEMQKPEEQQKIISAPTFSNGPIASNNIQITNMASIEEAKQLADLLNAGSLPADLNEIYSFSVGAQFGEQALDKTVFASIIGVILIFLYMIVYYRFLGVIASITLSVYIFLILAVFNLINGVLTLPGIAALVLGVGMAVDANIITYERIKEELKAGKTTLSAFKAGNKRSLATILDANITTILAAIVLFIFGTSSVKGFATMLIISIVLSFITAVYLTRLLLGLWVNSKFLNKRPKWFGVNPKEIKDITKGEEVKPHVFGKTFNFVKHRKKFFMISIGLVLIGVIFLTFRGLNLGIDFVAGTRVEVLGDQPLTTEMVEEQFGELGIEPKQVVIAGEDQDIGMARFDTVLSKDQIAEVNSHFSEQYGNAPNVSTVTPKVGRELAMNAVKAVIYASIGIIIYVAFRFELFFAITAIIALLHDAFFILALFSVFQFEFSVIIIAAILTIVGYSINDTIVTFDRIRENLRMEKRVKTFKQLGHVVNKSLMQTLARSFNTVITVVFAALMLFIFGAQAITYFSFALIVGLTAGTYSSLFLAAQLWLVWRGKNIDNKPVDFRKKQKTDGPQV
ncbi:protein translocase subunit SecDF [Tenuibacillus multivorans]|uniref:Multifunctional fusion protein n=1 Tax=Tenuibacillus multivorans TaxID=237069 RepID=A0A1G9ZIY0_9BACI|nr:protein translocase subunit SecDF [Tenuibacillus multivorans]GEL77481.1 protein translocase subunit SecDF [Tenuibacillus multivorans]SDN21278.1 SecD/SecF fusion protein [Tenuibacillus multivorans]